MLELLVCVTLVSVLLFFSWLYYGHGFVKAKVVSDRVKIRSIAAAIEARSADFGPGLYPDFPIAYNYHLTTPISYLPAPLGDLAPTGSIVIYDTECVDKLAGMLIGPAMKELRRVGGSFSVRAVGPSGFSGCLYSSSYGWDASEQSIANSSLEAIEYDPTNGTYSFGNIWRSQKASSGFSNDYVIPSGRWNDGGT